MQFHQRGRNPSEIGEKKVAKRIMMKRERECLEPISDEQNNKAQVNGHFSWPHPSGISSAWLEEWVTALLGILSVPETIRTRNITASPLIHMLGKP